MTTKFVETGDRLTINPGQTYTNGQVYFFGDENVPGVALDSYTSSDDLAVFATRGVYNLDVASGASSTDAGDPAYWDADNNEATDDESGNTRIGVFWGSNNDVFVGSDKEPDVARDIISIDDSDSPYTLDPSGPRTLLVADSQGGAITVNLPAAADVTGYDVTVKRAGTGTNAITLDGDGSEEIDGSTTNTDLDAQHDVLTITSDGTQWLITSKEIA